MSNEDKSLFALFSSLEAQLTATESRVSSSIESLKIDILHDISELKKDIQSMDKRIDIIDNKVVEHEQNFKILGFLAGTGGFGALLMGAWSAIGRFFGF